MAHFERLRTFVEQTSPQQKVRFNLPANIDRLPRLLDDIRHRRRHGYHYVTEDPSRVWCEEYSHRSSQTEYKEVNPLHLEPGNFWEFVNSDKWKRWNTIRVTEGRLLTTILERLQKLSANDELRIYKVAKFDTCCFSVQPSAMKKATYLKAKEMMTVEEGVKMSVWYFAPSLEELQEVVAHDGLGSYTLSSDRFDGLGHYILSSASQSNGCAGPRWCKSMMDKNGPHSALPQIKTWMKPRSGASSSSSSASLRYMPRDTGLGTGEDTESVVSLDSLANEYVSKSGGDIGFLPQVSRESCHSSRPIDDVQTNTTDFPERNVKDKKTTDASRSATTRKKQVRLLTASKSEEIIGSYGIANSSANKKRSQSIHSIIRTPTNQSQPSGEREESEDTTNKIVRFEENNIGSNPCPSSEDQGGQLHKDLPLEERPTSNIKPKILQITRLAIAKHEKNRTTQQSVSKATENQNGKQHFVSKTSDNLPRRPKVQSYEDWARNRAVKQACNSWKQRLKPKRVPTQDAYSQAFGFSDEDNDSVKESTEPEVPDEAATLKPSNLHSSSSSSTDSAIDDAGSSLVSESYGVFEALENQGSSSLVDPSEHLICEKLTATHLDRAISPAINNDTKTKTFMLEEYMRLKRQMRVRTALRQSKLRGNTTNRRGTHGDAYSRADHAREGWEFYDGICLGLAGPYSQEWQTSEVDLDLLELSSKASSESEADDSETVQPEITQLKTISIRKLRRRFSFERHHQKQIEMKKQRHFTRIERNVRTRPVRIWLEERTLPRNPFLLREKQSMQNEENIAPINHGKHIPPAPPMTTKFLNRLHSKQKQVRLNIYNKRKPPQVRWNEGSNAETQVKELNKMPERDTTVLPMNQTANKGQNEDTHVTGHTNLDTSHAENNPFYTGVPADFDAKLANATTQFILRRELLVRAGNRNPVRCFTISRRSQSDNPKQENE